MARLARSANLIVSIPAVSDVRASSGDGSLSISRITGTLDLRSGDGSIHGSALAGDLRVHTGDGSIDLDDVTGGVDTDTGDGSILVAGKLTSVRARSGDGRIAIRAEPGSTTGGDWDIHTGDGSITIDLPDTFGGELDAHTGDGGIRAPESHALRRERRVRPAQHARPARVGRQDLAGPHRRRVDHDQEI